MELKINRAIYEFFNLFQEFVTYAKLAFIESKKSASAVDNFTNRNKKITNAILFGSPLEKYNELSEKICVQLQELIFFELNKIRTYINKLEEYYERLNSKNLNLKLLISKTNLIELINLTEGSSTQIPLDKLIEYSDDAVNFANQLCTQVNITLSIFPHKNVSLAENFVIDPVWVEHIAEITQYTSFCKDNI